MKKILSSAVMALMICLLLTGCGKEEKKEENKELSLSVSEIIDKVYDGISIDDMPKLMTTDLNEENMSYYLGVDDLDIKEGIASEPAMSSIPWSVVVVKLNDAAKVEQAKKDIKEKVNPAKWVCVDAEEVIVENRGSTIILIMMDEENVEIAEKVKNNFNNLEK